MTQSLIDISPDASHPEGGHAIVLVRSVTEMPEPLRFTISGGVIMPTIEQISTTEMARTPAGALPPAATKEMPE